MKRNIFVLSIFFVLLILFTCSTSDVSISSVGSAPSNGTVTINLTNGTDGNGHNLVAGVYNDGANPNVDEPVDGGTQVIADDVASITLATQLTGGNQYDIYVLVDLDDTGGSNPLTEGDMMSLGAYEVTIDGNQTVSVNYDDLKFRATIQVNLTNAASVNGYTFVFEVFYDGESGDNEFTEGYSTIAGGTATASVTTAFKGTYDIYAFIDEHGDRERDPADGEPTADASPIEVTINATNTNETINLDGANFTPKIN